MARFSYSLIRFVPDLLSGEFVNMGAIVGSEETQEWSYQFVHGLTRVNALARSHGKETASLVHAQRLGRIIDDYNADLDTESEPSVVLSEQWLCDQAERLNHTIQLSEPGVLNADDAEDALAKVFGYMVLDQEPRTRGTDRRVAVRATREAYKRVGLSLGEFVFKDPRVEGAHHPSEFDFAVANGAVVQLVRAWSFTAMDQENLAKEIRSWAWSVGDIRQNGGQTVANEKRYDLAPNVEVAAVYVPPLSGVSSAAFAEAQSAFAELNVKAFSFEQAAPVAEQARALLEANHAFAHH